MKTRTKILTYIIAVIAFPLAIAAQDKTIAELKDKSEKGGFDDTTYKYNARGWKKGVLLNLSIAQGNSANWAAGAEQSSFALAGYATIFAHYKKEAFFWNNTLDLGYAIQRTSSQGSRKTDDKIDFYSKVGKRLNDKWAAAGVVNLRTQFTDGFDYNYLGKEVKRRISGWFAPAYLLVSPGIEWTPTSYFNIMFSPISARWVIVTNDPFSYYYPDGQIPLPDGGVETPLSANYGVNPYRKIAFEAGAYLSANFFKEVFKNVSYKSRLDLFSNYLGRRDPITDEEIKSKPQNIDVFWTNTIAMKVNKYLAVTYNLDLIYDDDVRQFGESGKGARTQVRSLLGVGLAARF